MNFDSFVEKSRCKNRPPNRIVSIAAKTFRFSIVQRTARKLLDIRKLTKVETLSRSRNGGDTLSPGLHKSR